jgi:hypothetical protein
VKKKYLTLLIIFTILLATCTNDAYNPDVCFQENVLPIFISKCSMSGCHNVTEHKAGYDLSNYDGIMNGVTPGHPLRSEVYKAIRGSNPSMPRGQKLSQKEISYINIWIKMGAPNSSNCYSCDTINTTFGGRIKPLFNTWCLGCHSSTNAGGGYDLSNYAGVVLSITNNKLIESLKHIPGYSPMPKNAGSLSACDMNAIEKWVNEGYPNN